MTNAEREKAAQPKLNDPTRSIITEVADAPFLNGLIWFWVYGVTHSWRF
jgi:hypothetical protein